MNDLISRQAAIDALVKYTHITWEHLKIIYPMLNVFEKLPSAERHGRWEDSRRLGFGGIYHWFRQCSECLYEREDYTPEKDTNYCPNCGAKMDGDTE